MVESNRRRLERLEQLAHVSVGDARMDVSADIEIDALILEAEIWAHKLAVEACTYGWVDKQVFPVSAREDVKALLRRQKLSTPLKIKEQFKALEKRVREHGATPAVQDILVKAREFLMGTA